MARADSLARLAWAYGKHLARRRVQRPRSQLPDLLKTYTAEGMPTIEASEREKHPRLIGCINCGLCALAAGRVGKTRVPDLASSYMRLYPRLAEASSDLDGEETDLAVASSVCPVGLPLDEVAAVVRRITMR